jgi:cell division protease FtsH
MEQKPSINPWLVIAVLSAVLLLQSLWTQWRTVEPMAYSDFLTQLETGNVKQLTVTSQTIEGELKQALPDGRKRFVTTRVDPALARELAPFDVKFTGVVERTWLTELLGWLLPSLLLIGLWVFVMRRVQARGGLGGELLSIGKSRAKVYVETGVKVTFDDVAGVDEAKAELREVVAFLKDPQRYGRLGARIPKGILLVGPPGTGKTLLARAVAGEASVPFFSINGSEFVEMFVGLGAARVRDLFAEARKKAPAIIFIDELDALGRARGIYGGFGGADEKEQTLNQLLAELDGFDPRTGLVLLAATNRPEILDPALLRAGRFDRQVLVDRPDRTGRVQILKVHVKTVALAGDVSLDQVAGLTPGFSGAELANLVNEAAINATRAGRDAVTLADFTAAVERIVAGLERRNRLISEREREVVAYHEMGHALVALATPGADAVHKVSIIPRGVSALGYTIARPTEDRYLMTRRELEGKMAVLLGGRAAEQLVFGELSTGAADDIAKVTEIAQSIVMRYGMAEELANVVFETTRPRYLDVPTLESSRREYSEDTARQIDAAVKALVAQAFERSLAVLRERRAVLEQGARELLLRETLNDEDLTRLMRDAPAGIVKDRSVLRALLPASGQR